MNELHAEEAYHKHGIELFRGDARLAFNTLMPQENTLHEKNINSSERLNNLPLNPTS